MAYNHILNSENEEEQSKITEKYATNFLNELFNEIGVFNDNTQCSDENPLNSSISTTSTTSISTSSTLLSVLGLKSSRRHSIDTIERHNKTFDRRHSLHSISEYKNSYARHHLNVSENNRATSNPICQKKKLIINQFKSSSIGYALNSNSPCTEENQIEKTVKQYAKLTLKNILRHKPIRLHSIEKLKRSSFVTSFVESILRDAYLNTAYDLK
jgi:hypothetical protein